MHSNCTIFTRCRSKHFVIDSRMRTHSLSSTHVNSSLNLVLKTEKQVCQHYGFFRRSTEFKKWSVFIQIFVRSFEIFGFFMDFAIFWYFSTFFIIIRNYHILLPWSSWTANSDKKCIELNGAALNVKKPWVDFSENGRYER